MLIGMMGGLYGTEDVSFLDIGGQGASITSTLLDIITANGSGSSAASWSSRFVENFADDFGDFSKGGAKTVCKWTGVVLSLLSNGIDNYQEFSGDPSAYNIYRGIAETVTETGVDLLISSAVSAGIAACCVAPPAAAVVVASAAVVFLINKGSEAIFGRSLTEIVSDRKCYELYR